MAGGGYRGGSTIIHTGNPKVDVAPRKKKTPGKSTQKTSAASGLHLLSKEERRLIMKKVWASRRKSKALAEKKAADVKDFKPNVWKKFVADVKKLQSE